MRLNHYWLFVLSCLTPFWVFGQFHAPAGMPGSNAIDKDSSILIDWISNCTIERGWVQINNPVLGKATVGDSTSAIGKACENGVVSLGDGGIATIDYSPKIVDGLGADFAVFENGFEVPGTGTYHMELAFVEVSSDGKKYVRFPSFSLTDTTVQTGNFDGMHPEKVNNLAGKYVSGYGTPFDLYELKDSAGLDIQNVRFIRIIDVVGSLNDSFARRDIAGHKINDPWPTPYPSSGFDLDAVGIIHAKAVNGLTHVAKQQLVVYPNPAAGLTPFTVLNPLHEEVKLTLLDQQGMMIQSVQSDQAEIALEGALSEGCYLLRIARNEAVTYQKLMRW